MGGTHRRLARAASNYGYVQKRAIDAPTGGWRLNAAPLDWCDRRPVPERDSRVNTFFRRLYRRGRPPAPAIPPRFRVRGAGTPPPGRCPAPPTAGAALPLYRQRPQRLGAGDPAHEAPLGACLVMFCSPTMELGVDISALNTSIPATCRRLRPTMRSAAVVRGAQGQQALVITYCAALSPHDQWFFRHANDMVHGVVETRLDLANRDLVDSHLQGRLVSPAHRHRSTPALRPCSRSGPARKTAQEELPGCFNASGMSATAGADRRATRRSTSSS